MLNPFVLDMDFVNKCNRFKNTQVSWSELFLLSVLCDLMSVAKELNSMRTQKFENLVTNGRFSPCHWASQSDATDVRIKLHVATGSQVP